jgi:hypothetical protein
MLDASRRAAQRLRTALLRGQSRDQTHEGFERGELCAIATVPALAEDARAPRAECNTAHNSTCCSGSGAECPG